MNTALTAVTMLYTIAAAVVPSRGLHHQHSNRLVHIDTVPESDYEQNDIDDMHTTKSSRVLSVGHAHTLETFESVWNQPRWSDVYCMSTLRLEASKVFRTQAPGDGL